MRYPNSIEASVVASREAAYSPSTPASPISTHPPFVRNSPGMENSPSARWAA